MYRIWIVIEILRFLGPKAADALPVLHKLSAGDENELNREAAKAAIVEIAGK